MKKVLSVILVLTLVMGLCYNVSLAKNDSDTSQLLSELKIMSGDPNGDLRLDATVSRAEFAKIAVASSQYKNYVAKNIAISPFSDVPSTHWAAPYIKIAVEKGYCRGYIDATFRPNNTVTYEEAVTIMLRVLGYNDADFGISWPYGQIGLADNLGLIKNVDSEVGTSLTRRQVASLVYNALITKMKGSQSRLISIFDCEVYENVTILSITDFDVFTTKGTFEVNNKVDTAFVGKKGTAVIKNSNELVSFVISADSAQDMLERYVVYSVLDDGIVGYQNGVTVQIALQATTTVYKDKAKTSFGAVKGTISFGDVIYVKKTDTGIVDYISYEKGSIEGPITVSSQEVVSKYAKENVKVMRNGNKVEISAIQINDIIYYLNELNCILAYSNKVTGIYEKAEPNRDMPTSVVVSGVKYSIEGVSAFNKLSSQGNINYGDAVTLLLGKDNGVADVLSSSNDSTQLYGYMFETGRKEYYKGEQNKYTGYYVKIALADGQTYEYITDNNYENEKNSIVSITFYNGIAKVSLIRGQQGLSGVFDWNAKKVGTSKISSDVKILDVATVDRDYTGSFVSIFPSRLNGAKIATDDVLFISKNDKGEIENIILNDVTGDAYTYGLVTKVSSNTYTLDIGGTQKKIVTSDTFTVQSGTGAKLLFSQNGNVDVMEQLYKVSSGNYKISELSLTIGDSEYAVSDKVAVYKKNYTSDYSYAMVPISELINNSKDYQIDAYYDRSDKSIRKIRIMIITKK